MGKRGKKRKVDWDSLDPAEKKRRLAQKEKQKKCWEMRKNGEVTPNFKELRRQKHRTKKSTNRYLKRVEKRIKQSVAAGGEAVDPRQVKAQEIIAARKAAKQQLTKKERKIKYSLEFKRQNPQFKDVFYFENQPLPDVPVVIFPLFFSGNEDMKSRIVLTCKDVRKWVMEAGMQAFIDLRRKKLPGQKFRQWEELAEKRKKRIARIEIGAKEVKSKTVTIVRTKSVGVVGKKEEVSLFDQENLTSKVRELLRE